MDTFGGPQGLPEDIQSTETETQIGSKSSGNMMIWFLFIFAAVAIIGYLVFLYLRPIGSTGSQNISESKQKSTADQQPQTQTQTQLPTPDQMQNFFITRDGKINFPKIEKQEAGSVKILPDDVSILLTANADSYHISSLGYADGSTGYAVFSQDNKVKDFANTFSNFYQRAIAVGWTNLVAQRTENFAFMDLKKGSIQMRVGYKVEKEIINISIQTLEYAQ